MERDDGLGCVRGAIIALPFATLFWVVVGILVYLLMR